MWTMGESNSRHPDANRAHYHYANGPALRIENPRFPYFIINDNRDKPPYGYHYAHSTGVIRAGYRPLFELVYQSLSISTSEILNSPEVPWIVKAFGVWVMTAKSTKSIGNIGQKAKPTISLINGPCAMMRKMIFDSGFPGKPCISTMLFPVQKAG